MEQAPANRRGRGRPARSAEYKGGMRAHIAGCALRLFQQEGYAAVSMRKVAAEAGCTTKTVYAYFPAKIDILGLLWSEVFSDLFDELDALAAAEPDPISRLERVAQAYVRFWLEHKEHYFMVFMSGGISRTDVSGYVSSSVLPARFDLFARCIAEALGGVHDVLELRARTEVLVCALNGISQALITISGHEWTPPETLVQRAVSGILK